MDSHYGTKGMREVVVECPNGQNVTFQFSYVAGNNNGTSVEDGQIPEVIFYTWREKNMYLNFDVVLLSEKYLWNKYMYVGNLNSTEFVCFFLLHFLDTYVIQIVEFIALYLYNSQLFKAHYIYTCSRFLM